MFEGFLFALLGIIAFSIGHYLGRASARDKLIEETPVINQVKQGLRRVGPYPKPTGKTKPKANDDLAAWRKENERNL